MSHGNTGRISQLRLAVNPASAERARDAYLSAQQSVAVNMHSVRMYSRRLRAVEDFVLMHLDEELTIERVADHVHLSPDYFSRYFHVNTGVRCSRWIAELRIQMAKKLLETSGEPITTIAFLTGFSSLSSFERTFKSFEGRTARAYRRSIQSASGPIDGNRRF